MVVLLPRLKPWPEPKTVKYHWDHVVDEAMWLAKEFQKERKTKLAQVKRTAVQCLKSNKDFESRERLKLKVRSSSYYIFFFSVYELRGCR